MLSIAPLFKLQLKLFLEVGLLTVVPYFLIQYFPMFNAHVMPILLVDNLIPFQAHFIYLYQSLYLLILWRTFTFTNVKILIKFAQIFSFAVLISIFFFFLFPTICIRPESNSSNWLYQNFIRVEKPLNAFPSMHVSLALITTSFALKDICFSSYKKLAVLIWTLFIIASTLFTKQHVFIDILGGCLVWLIAMNYSHRFKLLELLENRWIQYYQKITVYAYVKPKND